MSRFLFQLCVNFSDSFSQPSHKLEGDFVKEISYKSECVLCFLFPLTLLIKVQHGVLTLQGEKGCHCNKIHDIYIVVQWFKFLPAMLGPLWVPV